MKEQNKPSCKKQQKESINLFSLKFSIILSYYITMFSNSLLIVILYLSDLNYKLISYLLHLILIIVAFLSLRIVNNYTSHRLKLYRLFYRTISFVVISGIIYYIVVLVKMACDESYLSLVLVFVGCMIIWGIYHIMFIILIKMFMNTLQQRPMQKETKNIVDKKLTEMMLGNI